MLKNVATMRKSSSLLFASVTEPAVRLKKLWTRGESEGNDLDRKEKLEDETDEDPHEENRKEVDQHATLENNWEVGITLYHEICVFCRNVL